MKILISSHLFYPSVGGIETVTEIIAEQFTQFGHEVRLVTQTAERGDKDFSYKIYRRPKAGTLVKLVQWCDVFLHNNISLITAWPLLFMRRPWVVAHHVWLTRPDGRVAWLDYLKKWMLHFAKNITISNCISRALTVDSEVVGDPYFDNIFTVIPGIERNRDLVFLGRLVSDKGVNILLSALSILRGQGLNLNLTVIGDGPERESLERHATEELFNQVSFTGMQRGSALAEILNRHKMLIVPSLWEEPFGIVALEGIACGCVVVGSEKGGLKDAIGPCGTTFINGDVQSLADILLSLWNDEAVLQRYREAAPAHLAPFTRQAVARRYLQVMTKVTRGDT